MLFTRTAKANASVTASGRPSGTATTITVIPWIRYEIMCLIYTFDHDFFIINSSIDIRMTRIINVNSAESIPFVSVNSWLVECLNIR